MARVTIEDCLSNVDNRFELVVLAAERARRLAFGDTPLVPKNNDKYAVIALREMQLLNIESLRNSVIKRNQRKQIVEAIDQPEDQLAPDLEASYQNEMTVFASSARKKQLKSQSNQDD